MESTLVGRWEGRKYGSRRASARRSESAGGRPSNSRGCSATRSAPAWTNVARSRDRKRLGLARRPGPSILETELSAPCAEKRAERGRVGSSSRHSITRYAVTPTEYRDW